MRQQLCDYLEHLWQQGITERYTMAPRSAVPILDGILTAHAKTLRAELQPEARDAKRGRADATEPSQVITRARRQQAGQAQQGRSRS
jgi:hypothetical protein